ncbi:MAG: PP2C family protein-serine/threonine phosphatase [Longimicrobiales bacterium]
MTDFAFGQRAIQLAAFGRSDPGLQRTENQDDFLVADLSAPDGDGCLLRPEGWLDGAFNVRSFALGPKGALVLVADGMGGAAAGALASRLAATWIHQELSASWGAERSLTPQRFATALRDALVHANHRIHDQALHNPDFRGMGTTATAVGVLEDFLYLAQVGDSRAYLVRDGDAIQLTRDQSMVQAMIDAGTITEEQAESSGHRSVILQALGAAPDVRVDLTYQEIRRGDVVVLCSDGLSRVVKREEIADAMRGADDLASGCDALVGLANERGGPDNITVVAVRFEGEGLSDPGNGDAVGRNVFPLSGP